MGSNKLLPKYIGPFRVLHRQGNAYTIELPRKMRTHPTFYVGRLRPYVQYAASSNDEDSRYAQTPQTGASAREPSSQSPDELSIARHSENEASARSPTVLQHDQPEHHAGRFQAVPHGPQVTTEVTSYTGKFL